MERATAALQEGFITQASLLYLGLGLIIPLKSLRAAG